MLWGEFSLGNSCDFFYVSCDFFMPNGWKFLGEKFDKTEERTWCDAVICFYITANSVESNPPKYSEWVFPKIGVPENGWFTV